MNDRKPAVWISILAMLGLACSVITIYAPVIHYQFVNFDDDVHVFENPAITTGLTWSNLAWDFGIHGPSQWHPLAWISHQVDCELYGLHAGGHHATNVLLHLLSTLLLYWTMTALGQSQGISFWIAMAFAVHPLNVESVAWVSERRNVLCSVFFCLTILAYVRNVKHPTWWGYGCVAMGHAAALMSKPLAVTLPCVLLLLDIWPLERLKHTTDRSTLQAVVVRLLVEKMPLLLLSGIASVLTILCQRAVGTIASFDAISFPLRVTNALAAYGWYLQKLFVPTDLGVFYPHPALVDPDPWSRLAVPAVAGTLVLLFVTVGAVVRFKLSGWLFLGWFWFLGMLVPMIGVFQVGEQQQADRYAYLPLIGLFLALGHVGSQVARWSPGWRQIITCMAFGVLLSWGMLASKQVTHWRNSITLFSHTIAVTRNNHWAHNNLGFAYLKQGQLIPAVQQFELAIQAVPRYALAHVNLGVALVESGQTQSARQVFTTALQLDPNQSLAHQHLGALLMQSGESMGAIDHFRQAARLTPNDHDACFNLGLALTHVGQAKEASEWLRTALRLRPDREATVLELARALDDSGQQSQARQLLEQYLHTHPDATQVRERLKQVNIHGSGSSS